MKKWMANALKGVVGILVVGLIVVLAMPDDPTTQSVNITFPGNFAFEMDVSEPEIAHSALLEQLFSEQFTRDGVIGWLATEQRMFRISDARLATALENELCDPIPDSPLPERIEKGRECVARPVVSAIRQLQEERRVPFHYVGVPIQVGVQANQASRPFSDRANVCRESEFLGRRLELIDPISNQAIEVLASGSYPCTGFSRYPDVQLGPAQARELFNRPLLEYQDAVAVVLD